MSSKVLISALAAVAAIAVLAAPQDPSFEFPAAKHIGFDAPKSDSVEFFQRSEKFSVSFKNATIREVLDWLKSQGLNFVVSDDQVNKDGKINLNIVNQSAEDLMRALGSAWNGHWTKENDVWVFHRGRDQFNSVSGYAPTVSSNGGTIVTQPTMRAEKRAIDLLQSTQKSKPSSGTTFTVPPLPTQSWNSDQFQKMSGDQKSWEEFQRKWEDWAKEYEKAFQEFEKNFRQTHPMDPKWSDQMKKLSQNGFYRTQPGQGYIIDGKDIKPMDEKQQKELQKRIADVQKDNAKRMEEIQKLNQKRMSDMMKRQPFYDSAKARELLEKGQRTRSYAPLVIGSNGNSVRSMLGSRNLKEIYNLMTPVQAEKLKKYGYLNYSDLNSRQRALLGVVGDESWTISYSSDGVSITIKSDH